MRHSARAQSTRPPWARRGISMTAIGATAASLVVTLWATPSSSSRDFRMAELDSHLKVPVVMVVFDELSLASLLDRHDRIDEDLFPNFAALQRHSTWYRNATTVAPFTKEALPSLLAGFRPASYAPPDRIYPKNLFTLLGGSYEVYAAEDLPRLCPERLCDESPEAVRVKGFPGFGAGERGYKFGSFLASIPAPEEASLHFVHLAVPHGPWRYLHSGQRYPETEPIAGETDPPGRGSGWDDNRWLTALGYQRHLLQVQLADRLVGRLLDRLKEAGIYDEALVIVTSDHGIAFESGLPRRLASERTVGEIASIPLFVRSPGQKRARISDVPMRTIDLLPTIAAELGIEIPWDTVVGRPATSLPPSQKRTLGGIEISAAGSERATGAERKYLLFGRTEGELDLFELAPPGTEHLLGQKVRDPAAPLLTAMVSLPEGELYEQADGNSGFFPALIEGEVLGVDAEPGMKIALTVQGRIVAVTETYGAGPVEFVTLVAPKWFRKPPHDLGFVQVSADGKTLTPLLVVPGED